MNFIRTCVLVFEIQHLKISTKKIEVAPSRGKSTLLKGKTLLIQKKTVKEENENSQIERLFNKTSFNF